MPDNHYPRTDVSFIIENLLACDKINPNSQTSVGNHFVTFMEVGHGPMRRKLVTINVFNGEVLYEQATYLAARFQFMGNLLTWLEKNKNWKEGAYIVPQNGNTTGNPE